MTAEQVPVVSKGIWNSDRHSSRDFLKLRIAAAGAPACFAAFEGVPDTSIAACCK